MLFARRRTFPPALRLRGSDCTRGLAAFPRFVSGRGGGASWQPEIGMDHASRRRSGNKGESPLAREIPDIFRAALFQAKVARKIPE